MNDSFLEHNYGAYLPRDKNARILDLGCGEGRCLRFVRDLGYANVTGVDRNPEAVEKVRQEFGESSIFLTSVETFLEEHRGQFDLIIMKDMLYYIRREQVTETLQLAKSALRAGGQLVVEVFNGAAFTGSYPMYKDHQIELLFTEQSIRGALTGAGFSEVQVLGVRIPVRTFRQWLLDSCRRIWEIVLKIAFVIERGFNEQNPRIFTPKLLAVAQF